MARTARTTETGPVTKGRFGRPTDERGEPLYAPEARSDHLPPMEYRDMPEPLPLRKVLGPSVILAGIGVGSGEYILWPYISSNAGIGFLYLAVVGVTLQYFLNMEIERYTLATGETAIAGFARSWKPWGILFCVMAIVPNVWPGWGTAGATIFTYLVGGDANTIAIIVLLAIGISLTTSPVVYRALESAEFFKVGLTIVFLAIAIVAGISASAWGDLGDNVGNFGTLPTGDVAIATLLAGLVFAGAGGANNLVQSNWIREKGFGMGKYVPRIESPLTGEPEPEPSTGQMMRQDEENLRRFNGWWKVANKEQLVSFWGICLFSIIVFSVLAYSTVYGKNLSDEADFAFIEGQGMVLKDIVGPWFGTFFWIFGTISLTLVALGVVDYVARLSADVLKTLHLRDNQRWSESKLYTAIVWGMCLVGCGILLSGFDAPLVLLVLSACLNGIVMFIYSGLLIKLNRQGLPPAIRVRGFRFGVLVFCVAFYGFFAGWYVITQIGELV
ncbi:MAG TPA: Nramp family divalent metal transporter [Solirubrobacter sp.]|nr:Nramp family divalent metal transporter [Solirubrobacter sp.]